MVVHGLLLAAGAGRRAGRPKALRTDVLGLPWVRHGVDVLLAGGCAQVYVVIGAAADEVESLLDPDDGRVVVVRCPGWSRGPGASLRAGLAALDPEGSDAVLIHLVDLPDVGAPVMTRVATRAGRDVLARATYLGRPGHPVLIGADHWPALLDTLDDSAGARDYLQRHDAEEIPCDDLATGQDIDGAEATSSGARNR